VSPLVASLSAPRFYIWPVSGDNFRRVEVPTPSNLSMRQLLGIFTEFNVGVDVSELHRRYSPVGRLRLVA
jgi:hypothetical protein